MSKSILSIILPFYHKVEEFRIALEYNKKYFTSNMEIVIPIDEPDSLQSVVSIMGDSDLPCSYKIKGNPNPHPWRNPAKAINVGLRMASGTHAIIMSPESILVSNVYSILMDKCNDNTAALGRVVFHKGEIGHSPEHSFSSSYIKDLYYGSICAPIDLFFKVNGYNESYNEWGRDDDDIRGRMKDVGINIVKVSEGKVLHYEPKATRPVRIPYVNDKVPFINGTNWGYDF